MILSLAQVDLKGDIKVSGGGLNGDFSTAQFHFHWGNTNSEGSEHTINNKQYPMEVTTTCTRSFHPITSKNDKKIVNTIILLCQVHLVHYSSKYSTLLEAADKSDGLVALSFMVEVSLSSFIFCLFKFEVSPIFLSTRLIHQPEPIPKSFLYSTVHNSGRIGP